MTYLVINQYENEIIATRKTIYEALWTIEYATSYEVTKEGSQWFIKHHDDEEGTYRKTRTKAIDYLEAVTGYTIRKA